MNLDMNQLRAFVTVAEQKSFSKASQKLCRVQSAISQQIQKLEGHLGTDLFVRGRRSLALTTEGDHMLAYAVKILQINDQAIAKFKDNSYSGVVRVGSSDTYASNYFPGIIKSCSDRFPELEVEVHCGYSSHLWERYGAGELDVVLTQECPPTLPSERVHSEPLTWVCAVDSDAFEKDPIPLALFTKGCGDRDLVLTALNRIGKAYRIGYHSTSQAGILAALSSGRYVSAVLLSTVRDDLRLLGESEGLPLLGNLDISLAYRDRSTGSIASVFADVARSYFQSLDSMFIETHVGSLDFVRAVD